MLGLLAATAATLLLLGAIASSAQAAAGAFTERAASPVALTGVAIDTATNTIYAQANGGTKFYSYSPQTNEWAELPEAPLNSGNNGGATYLNGKIYTSYTQESTLIGVYDIATKSWSTIANPLEEGTGDITAAGGQIYMVEGEHFVSYDPATKARTTLAEPPFFFHQWGGLQSYQGKIFGDAGDGNTQFGAYDIEKNTWEALPELPGGAVLGSALDPASGTYYAYGGYKEDHFYSYDISTKEWSEQTFPFEEIDDGGMVYVSLPGLSGVFATGGEDSHGFYLYTASNLVELSLEMSVSGAAASTAGTAELTYTIKAMDSGPSAATQATVTDALPAGLTLLSAVSSQGSCTAAGATVTCALGSLAPSGSATITIKASTTTTGSVSNTATVSSESFNLNPAGSTASLSAFLLITPAPAPVIVKETVTVPAPAPIVQCVVPKLRGDGLRKAKKALASAHCKLGKVRHRSDRKVKKGRVISQSKRASSKLAAGSKIGLVLSLGKKKHHGKKKGRRKHHKHHKH